MDETKVALKATFLMFPFVLMMSFLYLAVAVNDAPGVAGLLIGEIVYTLLLWWLSR